MMHTITLASLLVSVAARGNGYLRTSHSQHLQPDMVARTLVRVQDEWQAQALMFAECDATSGTEDCMKSSRAFEKSCGTVVSAVLKASDGDKSTVKEYFGDVCSENQLQGWRKERCVSLSSTMIGAMSADQYTNRQDFDVGSVCHKFWGQFTADERRRVEQERAEKEAEEKKLAEERAERERKEAEEAAAREKQRKEEEAAAKRQHDMEEADRRAAEAKKSADEAAARVAAKKAEAEKEAEEAQKRMEEAKAAAEAKVAAAAEAKAATEAKNQSNSTVSETNATAKVNQTENTIMVASANVTAPVEKSKVNVTLLF